MTPLLKPRYFFSVLGLAGLLAGCAQTPGPAPTPAAPPTQKTGIYQSMMKPGATLDAEGARDLISLYRRSNGLGNVEIDPALMAQAQAQAKAMAARDKLSHEVQGSLTARLNKAGFQKNVAVENVSAGYDTMAEVFSGWRNSPPHNANLLAPKMTRMGVAAAYNPNTRYKVFWAMVMAN